MERTNPSGDDRSDAELLTSLQHGDKTASTALYRRHHSLVQRTCRTVIRDRDLAADLTHDVFIEFLQKPDRFDPAKGCVPSLLKTMARRRSIDCVRRIEGGRRREEQSAAADQLAASPASALLEKEAAVALRDAIERLPAKQRTVIDLAFWHGRTHRQMARDLQLPEGTVKARMRAALQRLRVSSLDMRVYA